MSEPPQGLGTDPLTTGDPWLGQSQGPQWPRAAPTHNAWENWLPRSSAPTAPSPYDLLYGPRHAASVPRSAPSELDSYGPYDMYGLRMRAPRARSAPVENRFPSPMTRPASHGQWTAMPEPQHQEPALDPASIPGGRTPNSVDAANELGALLYSAPSRPSSNLQWNRSNALLEWERSDPQAQDTRHPFRHSLSLMQCCRVRLRLSNALDALTLATTICSR